MGMDRIQGGIKRFLQDDTSLYPRLHDEEFVAATDAIKKSLPAAILAANVLASSPTVAQERRDPIGDIIRNSEKPRSIDELIRRLGSGKDVLDRMMQSIAVLPYPDQKDAKEIVCLAKNMWYEAANQGVKGQEAVGVVTMLRVLSRKYPDSVCGVVYQGADKRAAQYSWTPHEKDREVVPDHPKFKRITEIAETLFALKDDPEALYAKAAELELTRDTYFYKRHDWNENNPNEKRMSDANKWFWKTCVQPVMNDGSHVRHKDHAFYRVADVVCDPKSRKKP